MASSFAISEMITFDMVSKYIPPMVDKAKDHSESMMTLQKQTIPKWEKSGQGIGNHHGDNNDNNPLNDRDANNDDSNSNGSSSSDSSSKEEANPLGFSVLAGFSHYAL